ncbi:MAG TPA: hypothetical protein VJ715_03130 [Pyrinomonadaceae bacterium]|nr:hypothetical protein [Pyrinomonadaceae bacterium]
MRSRIIIPRGVLLVEIERRCRDAACNARTRVALTKEEARAYCGFECERCGQEWDDVLTERDVPDWWEELITDLYTLHERPVDEPYEPSEAVKRLNEEQGRRNSE